MSPPTPPRSPTRPAPRPDAPPPDRRAAPAPRPAVIAGVAAAAAGWVLPGLGHLLTGHTARGLVLAVTLGSLWLGGLLIGGLSVVDRQADPAWFLGQALLAPSLATDRYRARLVARHRAAHPDAPGGLLVPADDPPFEPAFGRARELGTLYTSLAGLLNLLAMLDVVFRPSPRAARGRRQPAGPSPAREPAAAAEPEPKPEPETRA